MTVETPIAPSTPDTERPLREQPAPIDATPAGRAAPVASAPAETPRLATPYRVAQATWALFSVLSISLAVTYSAAELDEGQDPPSTAQLVLMGLVIWLVGAAALLGIRAGWRALHRAG